MAPYTILREQRSLPREAPATTITVIKKDLSQRWAHYVWLWRLHVAIGICLGCMFVKSFNIQSAARRFMCPSCAEMKGNCTHEFAHHLRVPVHRLVPYSPELGRYTAACLVASGPLCASLQGCTDEYTGIFPWYGHMLFRQNAAIDICFTIVEHIRQRYRETGVHDPSIVQLESVTVASAQVQAETPPVQSDDDDDEHIQL